MKLKLQMPWEQTKHLELGMKIIVFSVNRHSGEIEIETDSDFFDKAFEIRILNDPKGYAPKILKED